MPKTPITLLKGDKHGSETDYRDQLPINMQAVVREMQDSDGYFINYPGLVSFGTAAGIDRGGIYNDRKANHYRVSGTKFITVASDGTVVQIAGTVSGTKQAAMPYSFTTQAIIVDGKMWLFDGVATLTEITDGDLGNPIDGVWINSYYFLTDGEYIYHTDVNDETAIDPLKFATAEFMPDTTLGVAKTQDNKVAVFGRYTIEYFADVANANFAFTRIETRAQKIGIVATHAKCEYESGFFIIGGRKYEAVGAHIVIAGSISKVSTREVDKVLATYNETELADIRVESRMEDDIIFILMHLPNETLCFNATIAKKFGLVGAWHKLTSGVAYSDPYRAINGIFDPRIGKWIFGDIIDTSLGKLDNTVVKQYSNTVEWQLFTPILALDGQSINKIELITIPGFTDLNDATVAISLSYDGGVIFGTEYWNSYAYGAPRDYNKRFIYRRLGVVNDTVNIKFRAASDSKMAFALLVVYHD